MAKSNKAPVNRRGFLKGAAATAAAGAAALVADVPGVEAQPGAGQPRGAREQSGGAPAPGAAQIERDAGNARPPLSVRAITRPGSDLMVQVLKDMGVEYVAANPGSSIEGHQESLINYCTPPNRMPKLITALHEESAVTMA